MPLGIWLLAEAIDFGVAWSIWDGQSGPSPTKQTLQWKPARCPPALAGFFWTGV